MVIYNIGWNVAYNSTLSWPKFKAEHKVNFSHLSAEQQEAKLKEVYTIILKQAGKEPVFEEAVVHTHKPNRKEKEEA